MNGPDIIPPPPPSRERVHLVTTERIPPARRNLREEFMEFLRLARELRGQEEETTQAGGPVNISITNTVSPTWTSPRRRGRIDPIVVQGGTSKPASAGNFILGLGVLIFLALLFL